MRLPYVALAIIFLMLPTTLAAPAYAGPFVGFLEDGETAEHEYRHMSRSLGEKFEQVQCKTDRPHFHFVNLYYDTPDDVLTLRVRNVNDPSGLFEQVAVGQDGHAQIMIDMNYDACPHYFIEVEGTDVADSTMYRVHFKANAS